MRIVIQRVSRASLKVADETVGKIENGLLVFLGISHDDQEEDVHWLAKKLMNLRIFNDDEGKMNRSLLDVGGDLLVVSQFTLHASTRKGNRPSFIKAAHPDLAKPLYQQLVVSLEKAIGKAIFTGVFGADMKVELINDGPVTIWIDSRQRE